MAELTKEYFDAELSKLPSKDYLDEKINAQTEALARMVNAGFEEVYRRLDVHEDVDELRKQMDEVRRELKLA